MSLVAVDVRLLGMLRAWFGLVLLGDLIRRFPYIQIFYSEDGLLPSHGHLFSPLFSPGFSLFHPFNTRAEVAAAFAATGAVYLCYLLGYRTRLAQALSLLLYTSLNSRNVFLENTGAMTLGLALSWTLLLPMGRAWSVDAALGRGRGPRVHRSLAVAAIPLQIAVIYALNAAHKSGETWLRGEAFHWVLWQDRIASPLAGWLRLREPAWLSPLLSWSTLLIEAAAPALVLWPGRSRLPRGLHVAATTLLHGGIWLLFDLGVFPAVMLGLNAFVAPQRWVDRIDARLRGALGDRFAGAIDEATPAPPRPLLAARELCAAWMLAAAALSTLRSNWIIPPSLRPPRVELLALPVDYLRLHQSWSLFAPEAPRSDGALVVEATTASGQRIDPLTLTPPDLAPWQSGPSGRGQFWCDYALHIQRPELTAHRRHLGRYLQRWHQLTGRPERDRIARYRVWWIPYRSPPPGQRAAAPDEPRLLLEGP